MRLDFDKAERIASEEQDFKLWSMLSKFGYILHYINADLISVRSLLREQIWDDYEGFS